MPVAEGTGRYDRKLLRLMGVTFTRSGQPVVASSGSVVVHDTAKAVRGAVRAIRPQELERLRAIDAEVERLRSERREVLKLAWQRGHVVSVGELRAKADQRLKRRSLG